MPAIHGKPVIPQSSHRIPINAINENALKVLHRLNKAGFEAYLVGGCVRDLILGTIPKDFDVATNAHPEQIRKLFKNCRLIGRRFLLAHIYFKSEIIEVSTFRGHHGDDEEHADHHHTDEGMIVRDNVYGTLEEDVMRRDFTMNALYYTVTDFSIVDFTGGFEDLKKGIIRIIGDAKIRYREDPVRMLRAIRFASKLNLPLSKETAVHLPESAALLTMVSNARLSHEILKLFHSGQAFTNFKNLLKYDLFRHLFPEIAYCITDENSPCYRLIALALNSTDERIQENKSVSPVFLFAMLLWYPMLERYTQLANEMPHHAALEAAINNVIHHQNKLISIPKRLSHDIREIWRLQFFLEKRPRHQVFRLWQHERFRAAYDLLLLRSEIDSSVREIADWWTAFLSQDKKGRDDMIVKLPQAKKKRRRK